MIASASRTASLFGTFNLKSGVDRTRFEAAFRALSDHLVDEGLLQSSRLLERAYHDGYDANIPDTELVMEMKFPDPETALTCWEHFQSRAEPLGRLHRAVNSSVRDAHFVLCTEIA